MQVKLVLFFLNSVETAIVSAIDILFLPPWWIDFDPESFRDKLFIRKDYGQFELGFSGLTRAVVSDLTSFTLFLVPVC